MGEGDSCLIVVRTFVADSGCQVSVSTQNSCKTCWNTYDFLSVSRSVDLKGSPIISIFNKLSGVAEAAGTGLHWEPHWEPRAMGRYDCPSLIIKAQVYSGCVSSLTMISCLAPLACVSLLCNWTTFDVLIQSRWLSNHPSCYYTISLSTQILIIWLWLFHLNSCVCLCSIYCHWYSLLMAHNLINGLAARIFLCSLNVWKSEGLFFFIAVQTGCCWFLFGDSPSLLSDT